MIDLSTTLSRAHLAHAAGSLGVAACHRNWTAFADSRMPERPRSCCIRYSKSSCGRKSRSSSTICPPARKAFAESIDLLSAAQRVSTGTRRLTRVTFAKPRTQFEIPIIASLNGATVGGWTRYAEQIEQAGADAIECNIYYIPTDHGCS